jgi:hypothetical protein
MKFRWVVRAAVTASGLAAAVAFAAPAAADVAVNPDRAVQGDAVNLTFQVTNDSTTASVNRVEVRLPADAPIAEVYPLSVDDWAPQITMRDLTTPVASLHGLPLTSATAAVTWTAMPGRALGPGASTKLALSLGPLPEVARLAFEVVLTRSDGTTATLTPALTLQVAAPQVHDTAPAPAPEQQPAASYGSWVLATLLFVAVLTIAGLVWQRRSTASPSVSEEPDDDEPEHDEPELVAATSTTHRPPPAPEPGSRERERFPS